MIKKSFVWVKVPRCGLGNQLFPIALALLFARINNLPIYFTNYTQIKIGPYLRGERTKRNYRHLFKFDNGLFFDIFLQLKLFYFIKTSFKQVRNPTEKDIDLFNCAYIFDTVPSWKNYFHLLNENRLLVIELIESIINDKILDKIKSLPSLNSALHIRLGDFAKLTENTSFAAVGCTRTPSDYFFDIISIFTKLDPCKKIFIFSDGHKSELEHLLSSNVILIQHDNDLIDLFHLSKSSFIGMSAGSTFSYWAGFLGDALLIYHDAHPPCLIKKPIEKTMSLTDFKNYIKVSHLNI